MRLWAIGCATALALAASCSFETGGRPGGGPEDGGPIDASDPDPDPDADDPDAPDADHDAGVDCEPNEQFCDGRTLRTCNEDGTGAIEEEDEVCAFTCAGAECVAASNLRAQDYETCNATAPALAPPSGATIEFERTNNTRRIRCEPDCGDPSVVHIEAAGRESQGGGLLPIAWFCLERVELDDTHVLRVSDDNPIADPLAFFVDGPVVLEGTIDVSGRSATEKARGRRGPGGWSGGKLAQDDGNPGESDCGGEGGERNEDLAGGGGGGGQRGSGGNGGDGVDGDSTASGGSGLGDCGDDAMIPLAGGYGGGSGAGSNCGDSLEACGWPGGGGGGALQISSRVSIDVQSGGAIRANGGDGFGKKSSPGDQGGGGGGGSGGSILLEAPEITAEGVSIFQVQGGDGGDSGTEVGGSGAEGSFIDGFDGETFEGGETGGGSGGGGGSGRLRVNADSQSGLCEQEHVSPKGVCTSAKLLPEE